MILFEEAGGNLIYINPNKVLSLQEDSKELVKIEMGHSDAEGFTISYRVKGHLNQIAEQIKERQN